MRKFVIKRLINALIAFALIATMYSAVLDKQLDIAARSSIHFAVRSVVPPPEATKGKTPEEIQEITQQYKMKYQTMLEKSYGLDKPYMARILSRTWKAVRLDLGTSRWMTTPPHPKFTPPNSRLVRHIIVEALPHTLLLFVSTTVLSVILGVILGVLKARWLNTTFDKVSTFLTMFFFGTPTWWIGAFMILIFAYKIPILPVGTFNSVPPPDSPLLLFWDILTHLLLPLITVVITRFWGTGFMVKSVVLQPLQEDYITSARARGIPERKVLLGHTLRSASPAIITMSAVSVVTAIAGDVVFERVMGWPGIGYLFWDTVQRFEPYIMLGILMMITLFYISAIVVLDCIYAFLDPRIKY